MSKKPNVIVIYCDDLGYGDLSCYGASDLITPNVDKLVSNGGIRFNSGYSTSAVCTPARYSILTGAYPFRHPDTKILAGNAGCIIAKDQMTLPKVFKQADYTTGIVGKWHLGLGDGDVDFNNDIDHTPNDVGFDHSFIFPATADRVPCVYLRDRKVVNLDPNDPIEVSYTPENPYPEIPTYKNNPELLKVLSSHGHNHSIVNGVGRIGYMRGGEKALWRDEDLAEDFANEAKKFISDNKENPFFLWYTLHQPHVPRVPNEKFIGVSGMGPRGDVIAELDWCVGQVTDHLEAEGLLEDTIIIFSSDNGPVLDDGYCDRARELLGAHKPAGPLRGGKYSKFEGGARVPFIVSWKGNISPKSTDGIISQVDLTATFAEYLGVDLAENDAPDSISLPDLLLGKNDIGRSEVMFESVDKVMVIRDEKFAYIPPTAGKKVAPTTLNELGNSLDRQLYNLQFDLGQQDNVADFYPNICDKFQSRIDQIANSSKTR